MAIGIIGGTGLTQLDGLIMDRQETVSTEWGNPSAPLLFGRFNGSDVVFLARHGNPHVIPPHKVNYRANIAALKAVGVDQVIAVTAVGGISQSAGPRVVLVPDQIIDYSYGREHTYFDGQKDDLTHIDFTWPYCQKLRQKLIVAATQIDVSIVTKATYAATQGPRLESAAEIRKLAHDGCDIVGMTGMPEASLAREAGLCYANLSVVVNWGAGLVNNEITLSDIERELATGMDKVKRILAASLT